MNLQLFKAFVPSWRFFSDIGHVPVLHYRFESAGEFSNWQTYPSELKRSWLSLFFNPNGNAAHAVQNLLTHLMLETQSSEPIDHTVSFQLVKNLIENEVPKSHKFQFKLGARDLVTQMSEDILVSPVYEH